MQLSATTVRSYDYWW